MRLPKEMGLPPDTVARQVRCVYGTRDAGKLWEETYTVAMESLGFKAGESNPCIIILQYPSASQFCSYNVFDTDFFIRAALLLGRTT